MGDQSIRRRFSPIDIAFFANNLTNNHVESCIYGFYGTLGWEDRDLGEPLTFGSRVRCTFGG